MQWGPRYLLMASGPLVVLTADVLEAIGSLGWPGILVAVLLVTGSAMIDGDRTCTCAARSATMTRSWRSFARTCLLVATS